MRDFFEDVDWSRWSETIWTASARVFAVILATYIALRIIRRVLRPAIRAAIRAQMAGAPQDEIDKRADTLFHAAYRTISALAVFIGLLTVLPEFGINIGALLAGAGIAGVAVGFGAQSLVRDILSGIFVLAENQYSKGDVVTVSGVTGVVEDVNLRRTILRDIEGVIHSVPNGLIAVSSNRTRVAPSASVVVSVSYREDLDHVFAVIDRAGAELANDPAWSADLTGAPKALGVEEFADSAMRILVLGGTKADRQLDVTRELRRRIKQAFDAEGIEIPYPHRTLVTAGQKAADGIVVRQAASA